MSLWEIEPLTTFPMYPSLFPLRLKRPWHPGSPSLLGTFSLFYGPILCFSNKASWILVYTKDLNLTKSACYGCEVIIE